MMKAMTHRERMLAAISHEQPDRAPLDLNGSKDSTIVWEGYDRLKRRFNLRSPNQLCDRLMRVVCVEEPILQSLDISTRAIFPGLPLKGLAQELGPRSYRDMWGIERSQPEGSYYNDQVQYPLSGDKNLSDLLRYPWPDPDDPGFTQGLRERLRWIRAHTDCAAVLTLPAPFIHTTQYLRGFEDWYCDIAANAPFLEALFDAVLDINMRITENELRAIGQEVDIVFCADDLGTQTGLQMRKADYLRYVKPRHARFFRRVHELTPAKVAFHCCGAVSEIIDDFAEIGIEALNPFQVTAAGMDPAVLKRKFKGKMAFWGGMDTQALLPRGSVQEVRRAVENMVETMGEGGGYVFSACHNIQPDVPVENILAMYEHARDYVPTYLR
jgi:uroporphyrinogen decarboxylase